MQHTQNYQLPQWEKSDRILMEDFNEAMSNIETAIDGAKSEASSGIAEAKSQASAAQAAADAAKQTALTYKHFAVGQYNGTGLAHDITLGFKPSAVMIWPCVYNEYPSYGAETSFLFLPSADEYSSKRLLFTDNGFHLAKESKGEPLNVNYSGDKYFYIAFQ